jgi:2-methylcitrate dehydratase PrpD
VTAHTQPTRTRTISERLADHVVGLRCEDIPDAIVQKAKAHLAHHFGTAFQGFVRENGQQAVRVARELSGANGQCSIVGEPCKADLLDAVFANAFLMHCAGLDDVLLPPGSNPGVVTNPVAWAFGETTNASGRNLLAAVIAGYDVMGTLSDPALTFGLDDYRPAKHVLLPFGAAATAARLLGLSHEQTVHAFGHAGQVGRNVVEDGDHVWTMHPLLARNGAMASMLARAGMPASPTVIEGDHGVFRTFFSREVPASVETGLATLGHEFAIARAQIKRQPVSALNVIPVELTQQLLRKNGLSASSVAAVELVIPRERQARETQRDDALVSPSADRTSRLGSPRFWVAMILVDGRINLPRVERPPDAHFLSVLDRIGLRFEPGHPLLYARVEVTTTDGQHYAAEGDSHFAPPNDWAEWLAEGGRAILPEQQLARLAHLIRNLENVPNVSEVMACVVPEDSS